MKLRLTALLGLPLDGRAVAAGGRPGARREGGDCHRRARPRHVRRRLLLVHGAAVREDPGRAVRRRRATRAAGSRTRATSRSPREGPGHAESVQVAYDPSRVSYEHLLEVFWRNVDPTDGGGQFCDRGNQYRTAIFYEGDSQKLEAQESKRRARRLGRARQAGRHRGRGARGLLPGRGLPPGLLQERPRRATTAIARAAAATSGLKELWDKVPVKTVAAPEAQAPGKDGRA